MKMTMRLGAAIVFALFSFAAQAENFHCDGRIHCSQMTSCEEATWFIQHCPNTKMDGNNDGVPCEKQWCNNNRSSVQTKGSEPVAPIESDPIAKAPVLDASMEDGVSRAFRERSRDVQLLGSGRVMTLLPDDNEGGRHQRFILQTDSGVSVLVAHNIDVAPRIDALRVGDTVTFYGEYVWNEKGGVIHWTHHDPAGKHKAGWVRHNGERYQ